MDQTYSISERTFHKSTSLIPVNSTQHFIKAMAEAGIHFKEKIRNDGIIHRFSTKNQAHKDGWYVFYGLAGAFGDWSLDIHQKWSLKNTQVPGLDKEKIFEQIEKSKNACEEERQRRYEITAISSLTQWRNLSESGTSPYLVTKKVGPFGIRFRENLMVVPLRDIKGKLWSLQYISPDGTKRFLFGGRKKGCFHTLGTLEDGKSIIFTEGYATGASVHMATQQTTVIVFDAGNLESVIEEVKKTYPKSPIIIAGDDDSWKESNVGRAKAEELIKKYGCCVVFPQFKNTETHPTDFNDLHKLEGLEEVRHQINNPLPNTSLKALSISNILSMKVPPREMILNPIIPDQGLIMVHAPRGIGKTHVSLMIAYTVATGSHMFQGRWTSPNPNKVLFIDGEMPLAVIKERLVKIKDSAETQIRKEDNLLIITPDIQNQSMSDLSTIEGQKIIEEHLTGVKLLILDNYSALCRRGRENDAESWIPLQEWFLTLRRRGISVLLIHHSNKTGGQRGTSRKEDLLDTIITLRKPGNYDSREGARFEVHYEKARGFYGKDAAPFEAWLKEEEGKFMWHVQNIEDSQMDRVLELSKEGLSQRDIAEETGLSAATINRRLKEAKEKGL